MLVIRETLQEVNGTIFAPMGVRLTLLKDCESAIPTLAQWMFEEWRAYDESLTKERLIASFKKRLNEDKLPFTVVALKADEPVGMVSLKDQTEPELSDFPKELPWLGSLQVARDEQNKGIGSALFQTAALIAGRLGYDKMLFYTSNEKNVAWYGKRGASVIATRPFRGHSITVLQKTCPIGSI